MHSTAPLAFLLSQHPAINHALLLREIRALRALGLDIKTVSIRAPDRPTVELSADEKDEQARTFYVIPLGLAGALRSHVQVVFRHPGRYLNGLLFAVSLSGWNLRKAVSLLAYFVEAVIIGHWMEQNRLTHVHVQYSSTVGLLVRRMFPVELSVSFHGPDEFNDPAGSWLREKIEASHFVRAISFYARSQLMKSCDAGHWNKIEVAYMGVDPSAFSPRPFRPAPVPFEILCVGRLAPVKAQHILLAAVEQLQREGRAVRLHLAGGGPDRTSLERAVTDRGIQNSVVIHGWVSEDQLAGLYRQADAFVLASFAEGLPGVLMEAMAMEIPCVSTWITGVPELIRDGVDGLLTPPSDPAAVARAVAALMEDPGLRLRIGQAGRRRVLETFDLQRNAVHLAHVFDRHLTPTQHARGTPGLASIIGE